MDLNTGSSRGSKKKIRAGIHRQIHKKIQEPYLDPHEHGSTVDLGPDLDPQAGSGSSVHRYSPCMSQSYSVLFQLTFACL